MFNSKAAARKLIRELGDDETEMLNAGMDMTGNQPDIMGGQPVTQDMQNLRQLRAEETKPREPKKLNI